MRKRRNAHGKRKCPAWIKAAAVRSKAIRKWTTKAQRRRSARGIETCAGATKVQAARHQIATTEAE